MSEYTSDTSGISSLSGFSYQIRVFVLYMLQMTEYERIEFETWDDVAVRQVSSANFDEANDKFRSVVRNAQGIRAIQVKRTALDMATCKQVLLNWMLLENSDIDVQEYILYTDGTYGNRDIMFNVTSDELYSEVMATTKKKSATIRRVKDALGDKAEFERIFNSIRKKYRYNDSDVDSEIVNAGRILFHRDALLPLVYIERVTELLNHITVEIIDHVNSKQPYMIRYAEMIQCIEEICIRITNKEIIPAYSDFKKINDIDFESLDVASSREYLQLKSCNLSIPIIRRHLIEKGYYQHIRFGYMETNKKTQIEDIEETAYGNFENAKIKLQVANTDTPIGRLTQTIDAPNSYAVNDQVRHGASIFLTRAEETERLISWEDSDNAKN